jgi:hypothetical protein
VPGGAGSVGGGVWTGGVRSVGGGAGGVGPESAGAGWVAGVPGVADPGVCCGAFCGVCDVALPTMQLSNNSDEPPRSSKRLLRRELLRAAKSIMARPFRDGRNTPVNEGHGLADRSQRLGLSGGLGPPIHHAASGGPRGRWLGYSAEISSRQSAAGQTNLLESEIANGSSNGSSAAKSCSPAKAQYLQWL